MVWQNRCWWYLFKNFKVKNIWHFAWASGSQPGCCGTLKYHLQYSGVPRVNTFFNICTIKKNVIKSYSKLLCFFTRRRKLYFLSVGCRNPKNVGKHWLKRSSLLFDNTANTREISWILALTLPCLFKARNTVFKRYALSENKTTTGIHANRHICWKTSGYVQRWWTSCGRQEKIR